MKGEDYADLLQAKPGDKICCSLRSINGILTLVSIREIDEHIVDPGKYSKSWSFIKNWITYEIITDYKIIKVNLIYRPGDEKPTELKVPKSKVGYILRRIPLNGGKYLIMNGTGLDTVGCKVGILSIKKVKDAKGTPKKFKDKYRFFNCKIDKIRDESNLTSHFKQELKVRKLIRNNYSKGPSKGYSMVPSGEIQTKLIEFDYDPSNFIIPYEVYRLFDKNYTVLRLPDDVTGLGYRFFNTVNDSCKVIYPNRRLTLKKDCLKWVNHISISGIDKLDNNIDTEVELSDNMDDMLVQIRLPLNRMHSSTFMYSKGSGSYYGTKKFIKLSSIKTGDIIKYPGCGKDGDVVLEIRGGKLITKNGMFDFSSNGIVLNKG